MPCQVQMESTRPHQSEATEPLRSRSNSIFAGGWRIHLGFRNVPAPMAAVGNIWSTWFANKKYNFEGREANLGVLWEKSHTEGIMFIALAIGHTGEDSADITDIGLSAWSPTRLGNIQCHHWRIGEPPDAADTSDFSEPDSFIFGQTQVIRTSDVKTVLDDWAHQFSDVYEHICLVVHNISSLNVLARYWNMPRHLTILDTQKIWQTRVLGDNKPPLEDIVVTMKVEEYYEGSEANFGNRSFFTMRLAQELWRDIDTRAKDHSQQSYGVD